MPRMIRSPPQGSPNARILQETRSEPDLSSSPSISAPDSDFCDSANITVRQSCKRLRADDSCMVSQSDGFEELKSMLLSWKSDQDKVLGKLVADISELRQQNLSIQKSNAEIEKSLKFFNAEFEEMKTRLDTIEAEHRDYVKHFRNLDNKSSERKVAILEAKIDAMEQQARQLNIEICNVPEKRNENLITIMESIGKAINSPVPQKEIVAIHRVPHALQRDSTPKNIIVKFGSRIVRDNLLSAYRNAKSLKSDEIGISGTNTLSVYLNEHLTLKNKALFREAKLLAKKNGFRYVWVSNSTILVRERDGGKPFAIRCTEDLKRITASAKSSTASSEFDGAKSTI